MIYFKLKGKITHIYELKSLYSKINEIQYFQKQKAIIQVETELYTVTFIDKKIELLKNVYVGSEVELDIKLKGRTWRENEILNSINELSCLKLNFVREEKILSHIFIGNVPYFVKKYYFNEHLMLKLINGRRPPEIDFSAVCDFMHEKESVNHILYSKSHDKKILDILISNQILEHMYDIKQSVAASGYVCKLLIQ